jgi:hypothetical protein
VTTKQFSKEDDEITNIGSIEFSAKSAVLYQKGTVTIEILQNGVAIDSATLSASKLTTTYTTQRVGFGIEVEGSFEVLIEYMGTGSVQAGGINVLNGTETETAGEEDTGNGDEGSSASQPEEQDIKNVIESKSLALGDDQSFEIQTVEFIAKSAVLYQKGTLTVAIVQDDEIQDKYSTSVTRLPTTYTDLVASFNAEVTGPFEVVIMYEGTGSVQANSIEVSGLPEPTPTSPDPDPDPSLNPDGTFDLTINAVDGNGNAVNDMWIEVYEGVMPDGDPDFTGFTPKTFPLEAGNYVVAVGEFDTNIFQRWSDGETDNARPVSLQQDTTLTAIYSTDGTEPGGEPDPDPVPDPSPPSTGGSGSIAVYAYRIPSSYWGDTFTGANAQMWITIHNSTGYAIYGHGTDENGYTFTGLNDGEQYWILAHDCHHCHGGTHTVAFDHWQDGSIEMARLESTGVTLSAYYEFVPDTP